MRKAAITDPIFHHEDAARAFLEDLLWPDGPVCPHCGFEGGAYKLKPRPTSKSPGRQGLYKCKKKECRKQYTVTVGTIFERSHIPLHKWLLAFHLICASKKGMSAHQLHRMLDIGYEAAWFLFHRIRHAMTEEGPFQKLRGIVEADETYVGGKRKGKQYGRGRGTKGKTIVLTLVERDGRTTSQTVERVTTDTLGSVLEELADPSAHLMTDELGSYIKPGRGFAAHSTVRHSAGEYARGEVHVNTAESYFALLKRGIAGAFHHVSRKHLHRYLAEFDFRWNHRKLDDFQRALAALLRTPGKRLMYQKPASAEN
ncbi:MAG TPA: IS1595 family transposase [Acidobacteriota bacterium]|nr:IS1595 family transposase [Acidobacteriota bacterium]